MNRSVLLKMLAERIVGVSRPNPVRVAIDGVDGAGKTTLADEGSPDPNAAENRRYIEGQQLYLRTQTCSDDCRQQWEPCIARDCRDARVVTRLTDDAGNACRYGSETGGFRHKRNEPF